MYERVACVSVGATLLCAEGGPCPCAAPRLRRAPRVLMSDEAAVAEWLGGETGPEGLKKTLPTRVQEALLIATNGLIPMD